MARIAHIAIKVAEIPPASAFFEEVFGFSHTGTVLHPTTTFSKHGRGGGHTSRHLSDGVTDLTLVHYDDEATAEPGSSSLPGPCVHHFGIEADNVQALADGISALGGQIVSERGLPTVKFRAPGGTMAEIVPTGWFSSESILANAERRRLGLPLAELSTLPPGRFAATGMTHPENDRPRITHIAIKVEDVEGAATFYEQAFDFKPFARYWQRDHLSVHLTDGTIDLAIIRYDGNETDTARAAGLGPCIHHIGIDVAEHAMERYASMIRERGCEFISDPGAVTVKFRIPAGGSIAEIAPFGWHFRNA
jgi:lactoylglutathione lyase